MATVEQTERSYVLHDVSWRTYQALREDPGTRNVRMTYDRGVLELMSPSLRHESHGYLLGRFIDVWTDVHAIEVRAARCVTLAREEAEQGLEPDNCYYIQSERLVRERDALDLAVDPPPDLVVEVEESRRAMGRLPLYASLRVPEVWRLAGNALHVHQAGPNGRYREVKRSRVLPGFPVQSIEDWLGQRKVLGDRTLVRRFREWVEAEGGSRNQGERPV